MSERATREQPPRAVTSQRTISLHATNDAPFERALLAHQAGESVRAAALFEDAQHFAEAAMCWLEAQQFQRALRAASLVTPHHGLFRDVSAAMFEAALAIGASDPHLDTLAGSFADLDASHTSDLELVRYAVAYQRMRESAARGVGSKALALKRTAKLTASRGGGQLPGEVFAGRYQIEELLGVGGSGEVYRARDLLLDHDMALKIVAKQRGQDANLRLRRELRLARELTHECIVRVHDLAVCEHAVALSMELIQGGSLGRMLEVRRLSLGEARDYLVQTAEALAFAHARGVVHRDVKPENLLLVGDGRVKISDFGIAKSAEGVSITRTGTLLGSPHYIAPEQIENFREVDHRADIYALGILAYQLSTGRLPFEASSVMGILTKHLSVRPLPPVDVQPEIPESLSELILAMLEKAPRDRIDSCAEIAAALGELDL